MKKSLVWQLGHALGLIAAWLEQKAPESADTTICDVNQQLNSLSFDPIFMPDIAPPITVSRSVIPTVGKQDRPPSTKRTRNRKSVRVWVARFTRLFSSVEADHLWSWGDIERLIATPGLTREDRKWLLEQFELTRRY